MSLSFLLTPRRLAATVALAGALGGAAVATPAIASAVSGTPTTHTSAERTVFVYYRCYVPGYGWMYCTDQNHS